MAGSIGAIASHAWQAKATLLRSEAGKAARQGEEAKERQQERKILPLGPNMHVTVRLQMQM